MIRLENVSKVFEKNREKVTAVKGVHLEVPKGEIHGVIGYSGAGKSTLVRCVNLLEEPTEGKVFIRGEEATGVSKAKLRNQRKNIGMIFQGFNLLKTASVYQNIALPLKLTGVSKQEIDDRVKKYLHIVDLEDKMYAFPNQLSGGQKQRVAIARALSQEPDILLSDEATSALDPETTNAILDLLLQINRELGITILLITHEMNVIQKICDRVYVMDDGWVVEEGSVVDLFTQPHHETTKRFLNTVVQRELSASIVEDLRQTGAVLQLTFVGESTGEPLLSQITKQFGLAPNILAANISELKNSTVGNLIIHVQGKAKEISEVTAFLRDNDVIVEEMEAL